MKINEVITEYGESNLETVKFQEERLMEQYQKLQTELKTNCQPYLNKIGGFENALFHHPLYRGISTRMGINQNHPVKAIDIRIDRRPMDTPLVVHNMIDDWFQKRTGYRFRSAGLFTTSSLLTAHSYGEVVVVIPRGEFHYAWSPKYSDMYEELGSYVDINAEEIYPDVNKSMNHHAKIIYYMDTPNIVDDFLQQGNYQFDKGLNTAIDSEKEIMMVCSSTILIDSDWLSEIHYYLLHNEIKPTDPNLEPF